MNPKASNDAWFVRHVFVYLHMANDFLRIARQHPEDAEIAKANALFWLKLAKQLPPVRLP